MLKSINNQLDLLNSNYLLLDKDDYDFLKIKMEENRDDQSFNALNEITFWNKNINNIPIVKEIKENFSIIKKEILDYCDNEKMYDYPRFKIYDNLYIYYNRWEVAPLMETTEDPKFCNKYLVDLEKNNFQIENISSYAPEGIEISVDTLLYNTRETTKEVQNKCAFLTSLVKKYEGTLYNCYISKLYPGCEIKPHIDRHVNLLRFHLGIQTDPNCKLTVGSETKKWTEGEFLVFNHGGREPHSVKHLGKKIRIVFSFDLPLEYVIEY